MLLHKHALAAAHASWMHLSLNKALHHPRLLALLRLQHTTGVFSLGLCPLSVGAAWLSSLIMLFTCLLCLSLLPSTLLWRLQVKTVSSALAIPAVTFGVVSMAKVIETITDAQRRLQDARLQAKAKQRHEAYLAEHPEEAKDQVTAGAACCSWQASAPS